ncbi:MAG: hypothetical protein P4M11_15715 [Candidatus Pacebacteria bacterium]|nr:hypothetical protein [Candidatus Paceibacterota bacterium]
MQQQQPHHTLRRSGSVPPRGPSASFLTSYPLPAETRNKVLAVESSRARTALEKAGIETLAAAGIDQIALREFHDEICAAQSEKLELYMRSRWATVLFALRETLKKRTAATTKRELMDMFISTLKEKVKEKIVFEMMNPSLAKIMRSKTPPADAPRKIREEYRKAHPEEADNFPEIVLQLSKVHMVGKSVPEAKKEDPATKSAAPILEKSKKQEPEEKKGAATQKHIFGHEEKKQAMVKFPYRSTQENPKYFSHV